MTDTQAPPNAASETGTVDPTLDPDRVAAYLDRLGTPRPRRADHASLVALQRDHLRTVPFENLAIHLGEEIELAVEPLVDKVVQQRRGGFCYQLNGAFAALLAALGYRVTLLEGRVTHGGGPGLPFDHMALRVEEADDGGPWLVDVGFGDFSAAPLNLADRSEQRDDHGTFLLRDVGHGDVEVLRDGAAVYRLSSRPRALVDYGGTCWYHRTSPMSPFTGKPLASRETVDGRITLSGRTLKRTVAGEVTSSELADEAAVLTAYREHFGIEVEREPLPGEGPTALVQSRSNQPS